MKNAVIYVFSGTGNTLKIARAYADEFFSRGVSCKIHILEKDGILRFPPPQDFDLAGLAYPIHAFNAPYVVHRFAAALPDLPYKEYFIIKSSGEPLAINNISSGSLVAKLEKKGYFLTNEYHYVMPYNMIFRHPDGMAARMWDSAKRLCAADAKEILDGKKSFLKSFPFGRTVSALFRIEHPAMKINGLRFKAGDKCTGCGKCVMCARCSFYCPADAISIGLLNGWKVNGAYDFDGKQKDVSGKMPEFLKIAYEKYFQKAEEKIALLNASQPTKFSFDVQEEDSSADMTVKNNH